MVTRVDVDQCPYEIAKLFPCLFGQPSVQLVPNASNVLASGQALKIGVVLSGGQAPGGHNVISGIFDYLQGRCKGRILYGFRGGPAGVMRGKYVILTPEYIYPYRNQGGFDMICSGRNKIETLEQFKQAQETAMKLDLDGLLTIDGDLKSKEVPTSFGFDTACKIYAEMIGNVMVDARSTGKYYHFVRLMGRAASHITLECALQTHPNITLIGEEVAAKKQTLKNVTDYIVDVICKLSGLGYNYGVILIISKLLPDTSELFAHHYFLYYLVPSISTYRIAPRSWCLEKEIDTSVSGVVELLPPAIQEQLLLERDPHGNVQVAKIETEKIFIQMVESELQQRKQAGAYNDEFMGQSHLFGTLKMCLPSNFDATYCYALGYGAGALLHSGKTGLISSVIEEWTVGRTTLTSLMDREATRYVIEATCIKALYNPWHLYGM
ncbi:carbohydrate kinase [Lithospermum erythrorhizon]|uniref:Carbohydrate kinase n=1 Tax=Lithospermum erythrorhizon TaxID=34254 RepID=A0AAV3RQS6_LITER